MQVAEIMRADVEAVLEETTVREAIVTLADAHVHGVPVVDRNRRLVGVVSSSDVLQATAETDALHELFDRTTVRDLMTTPARTISPTADVREAARAMVRFEVHRLFVVQDDTLAGVVSQSDIIRAVAHDTI